MSATSTANSNRHLPWHQLEMWRIRSIFELHSNVAKHQSSSTARNTGSTRTKALIGDKHCLQ
jgi:hypothetical protein